MSRVAFVALVGGLILPVGCSLNRDPVATQTATDQIANDGVGDVDGVRAGDSNAGQSAGTGSSESTDPGSGGVDDNGTGPSSGGNDGGPAQGTTDGGVNSALESCRGFVPSGGSCPSRCTSCEDGICRIECSGVSTCTNGELQCPPGWACKVQCSGFSECQNLTIKCADGPCDVECNGALSCGNLTLDCGPDACRIQCEVAAGNGNNFIPNTGNSCGPDIRC